MGETKENSMGRIRKSQAANQLRMGTGLRVFGTPRREVVTVKR